ncbi:hypothetical protein FO441_00955 [Salinicoccus cyprini]|uniref:Glycosyltransferase n=2 Tax=Salinicoccus cyprini TaxID=2493691 RepID=A0A558AX98_9STAP|nr:hypothetical protein FO441_00955 [Salinicoccus cyprini]
MSNKQVMRKILENTEEEVGMAKAEQNSDLYYSSITKFGITDKLNKIIDNFESPDTVKSGLYKKNNINIGIICDEFLFYSLKDTANFFYVPYTGDIQVNKTFDILLVVSSWRGLDYSWDYVANPNGQKRKALIELVRSYKENNIVTVFYSKEDPVSYNQYLSLAKECDFIFTSAIESVDDYKRDTQNENVDYLEFGVNPLYHNPIGKDMSNDYLNKQITFAGSWMKRYPERNRDALDIFEGVNKTNYDLCIIDRQYERKMERYHFPSYLIRNISATLPHERLMKLHKATMWGINLNSVKDSSTMFANRVYELQAMGNIIISNFNKGVHSNFPHIQFPSDRKDVEKFLTTISFQEQKRLIAKGISDVMLNHSAFHRVKKMLDSLGMTTSLKNASVLIVGDGENAKKSYNRQSYKHVSYIDRKKFNDITVDNSRYDFVAFFNNNISYREYYIENLLSTFAYTNADIVFMGEDKYQYVTNAEFDKSKSMFKSSSLNTYLDSSSSLSYFNVPATEINEINNYEDIEPEGLLTIIIRMDGEYKYIEDKLLLSLKNAGLDKLIKVVLLNNQVLDKQQNMILNRLLTRYNNLHVHRLEEESMNLNSVNNVLLDNMETKFFTFMSEQNQIHIDNFKRLYKYLKEDNWSDLVYAENDNSSQEISYQLNDDLLFLNTSIEGMILKTSFVRNNNVKFDTDLENDDEIFLLNMKEKSPKTFKFDKGYYTNFKSLGTQSTKSNLVKLHIAFEKEKKRVEKLLVIDLIDFYANNIYPTSFMEDYISYFRETAKEDKAEAFCLIEKIHQIYKPYYKSGNIKYNEISDLLFH